MDKEDTLRAPDQKTNESDLLMTHLANKYRDLGREGKYIPLDQLCDEFLTAEDVAKLRQSKPSEIWTDKGTKGETIIKLPNFQQFADRETHLSEDDLQVKMIVLSSTYNRTPDGQDGRYTLLSSIIGEGLNLSEVRQLRQKFREKVWIDKNSKGEVIIKII